MSTRAVYTFISKSDWGLKEVHIYKHHDGYPTGAIEFIDNATRGYASTDIPQRDTLVANFIIENRVHGLIEITSHWKHHGDLEYRYEIEEDLTIRIFELSFDSDAWSLRYEGHLDKFKDSTLFKKIERGVA